MPTEGATSMAENNRKPVRKPRKRSELPNERIVSLNLTKCVSHNLIDLVPKLEVSKQRQKKEALEKQGKGTARCSISSEKAMPTKDATSMAEKHRKPARKPRKRAKFSNIVSLNLSKCVSHNLINLAAKVEISKKRQKKEALEKQRKGTVQCSISREKEIVPSKITKMARKKYKSLGKRFIKEFSYFSESGEGYSKGNSISYTQTLKWLKKAELFDNHRITMRDVEVHFINKLKSGYELKVLEFIRFLKSLCEDRGLEMPTVIFKLLKCRKKKTIKKKKTRRNPKYFKRKLKTECVPGKKVSVINALEKKSKENIPLDNIKEYGDAFFETTSVSQKRDFLVLSSENSRKNGNSEVKTVKMKHEDKYNLCNLMTILHLNKNMSWVDSNVNSDPLCFQPQLIEELHEENFTVEPKDKTVIPNEYSKCINDQDFENIVSTEGVPMYTTSIKETDEWITPTLKSIPPLENEVIDYDAKNLTTICSPKKLQKSHLQNSKSSNAKKIKLVAKASRNGASTATRLGAIKKVKKPDLTIDTLRPYTEKLVLNVKESYEYIESDETDDNLKDKDQPLNKNCSFLKDKSKKVDIKTEKNTKSRHISLDKKASEIVSVVSPIINEVLKKKSRFHIPSKTSSSDKIRNYVRRIFSGDLTEKVEKNIKELKTKKKEMSPNRKTVPSTPRLQSRLQKPNVSPFKSGLRGKEKKDQKTFSSNNKTVEKISPRGHLEMPVPENKKKTIKNNRTFTNLPVKRVQKMLQKSRKEKNINKKLNNENSPPTISNIVVSTKGKKITSSKERAMSTKRDKIESKLADGNRDGIGSEIQISNTDANFAEDISKLEADGYELKNKKSTKKLKIRKGLRLRKKDLKDPKTHIQNQA